MRNPHTPRGIAETHAERLFAERFKKHMKNANLVAFKKSYRTLYTQVIIPTIADEHLEYQRALYHEGEWERLMMELVGADGPLSVRIAIEKMKADSTAYFKEITKQRETINELQQALEVAHEFLLSQRSSFLRDKTCREVNQALKKSRNQ